MELGAQARPISNTAAYLQAAALAPASLQEPHHDSEQVWSLKLSKTLSNRTTCRRQVLAVIKRLEVVNTPEPAKPVVAEHERDAARLGFCEKVPGHLLTDVINIWPSLALGRLFNRCY